MTSSVSGAERASFRVPRTAGAALATPSSRFERFKNSNASVLPGELLAQQKS